MKTEFYTTDELIQDAGRLKPPLDPAVIPNMMGINLVSVEGMSWTRQDDGQLVSLTIHFGPSAAAPTPPAEGESTYGLVERAQRGPVRSAEAVNEFLSSIDLKAAVLPVLPEEISSNGEGGFYVRRKVADVTVNVEIGRQTAGYVMSIGELCVQQVPEKETSVEKRLRPLGNLVVVQRDNKIENKTAGGILIPGTAQEEVLATGIVRAVGRGRTLDSGRIEEPQIKVGDRVAFNRFAGQAVPGRKDEFVLSSSELLGVFE